MGVTPHPNIIRNTGEVAGETGLGYYKQFITGALKHLAFALPTVRGVTLNLDPCVDIWQVEIGDVDGIRR